MGIRGRRKVGIDEIVHATLVSGYRKSSDTTLAGGRFSFSINNFLTNLWRAGALSGQTTDEAFFVKIRIGNTMTQNDIDNGRMIVEIGVALVKPAEFVMTRLIKNTLTE